MRRGENRRGEVRRGENVEKRRTDRAGKLKLAVGNDRKVMVED